MNFKYIHQWKLHLKIGTKQSALWLSSWLDTPNMVICLIFHLLYVFTMQLSSLGTWNGRLGQECPLFVQLSKLLNFGRIHFYLHYFLDFRYIYFFCFADGFIIKHGDWFFDFSVMAFKIYCIVREVVITSCSGLFFHVIKLKFDFCANFWLVNYIFKSCWFWQLNYTHT